MGENGGPGTHKKVLNEAALAMAMNRTAKLDDK